MDQLLKISFDIKKNDRQYSFMLPTAAPYGEVYDVLYEMLLEVAKMAQEAAKKAEKSASGNEAPIAQEA